MLGAGKAWEKHADPVQGAKFKSKLITNYIDDMADDAVIHLMQKVIEQGDDLTIMRLDRAFDAVTRTPEFLRGQVSSTQWMATASRIVLKNMGFKVNWLVRGIYIFKQLVGGLLSPTEWIELATFGVSGGVDMFDINNKVGSWFWNWGDNLLFLPLTDETTWGLFKLAGWTAYITPPHHAEFGQGPLKW